jgi:hypothetical protein
MRMNLLSERLSGKIRDPSTQFTQEAVVAGKRGSPRRKTCTCKNSR